MIKDKVIEDFQAKLRQSNNFQSQHTIRKISPFDLLYESNEADAIEIILKSMYGPNVDEYNWIGLSDAKFEVVEKSLERFFNLKGKWLDKEIKQHSNPKENKVEVEAAVKSSISKKKPSRASVFLIIASLIPLLIPVGLLAMVSKDIPFILSGTLKAFFYLFVSPFSFASAVYVITIGLLGEAAYGFSKNSLLRLLKNYWFGTLILAFIWEVFFVALFRAESYFF